MNEPILFMVELITSITGLSKAREDPTQYIRGRDTDKKLSKQLKERFGLQRDNCAYRIDNINSQAVRIGARILESKIVRGNRPVLSHAPICKKNYVIFYVKVCN